MSFNRMNQFAVALVAAAVGMASASPAFAARTRTLDPKYRNLRHPIVNDRGRGFDRTLPPKSNTLAMLAVQTPVKSQGSRGTCSIFSATAITEAMLVLKGYEQPTLDLSEEWLEYLIMRTQGTEGSGSANNFATIARSGHALERDLPYIPETWESVNQSALSQQRCGLVARNNPQFLQHCLLGHYDAALVNLDDNQLRAQAPDLAAAKADSAVFRQKYHFGGSPYVTSTADVKSLLACGTLASQGATNCNRGVPLTLDIDFYYGAWNHREAEDLGIQRNMDHWAKGIIGYPERGSLDQVKSPTNPAGHSVVVVGYDDNIVVTKTLQMADGTSKTFTWKGVYYFKNSWGTNSFGVATPIDGRVAPGYGMMVQQYANEYGAFYRHQLQ